MRKAAEYLTIVLSLIFLQSCRNDGYDPYYLKSEVACVVMDSKTVFEFNPVTCQESYNKQRHELRAFRDDMSEFFILRLGSLPASTGETVRNCSLKFTTSDDILDLSGLSFSVEKTDVSSGRIWLWCQSEKIFVVARFL